MHPNKAIFWKEKSVLILSDLHLGKAAHFRKYGIPIPSQIHSEDMMRLYSLIKTFSPTKIIIVGDLFHSDYNDEWNMFESLVISLPQTNFHLIKGNHDLLDDHIYDKTVQCFDELEIKPFSFVHDPEKSTSGLYAICGHIHPSISIKAKGRQNMRVSCFYFSEKFGVLPSFGNFTGNYKISFKLGDLVYLIVDDQIVPYKPAFYMD